MSSFRVPVVDISAWVGEGASHERARVSAEIDRACREVGFFSITGHRIADSVWSGLGEAIDSFFAMPTQSKRSWTRPAPENRGYTAPKSESLALSAGVQSEARMKDFFEAFNVGTASSDYPGEPLVNGRYAGHYAENIWPDVDGFRDKVDAWRTEAGRVARTLTRIFADALGLAPDFFDHLTRHPIEVLRMNNYALPEGTRIELDEDLIGMGEHTDFGIVTVLWADQVRGLQVLDSEGTWHDVQPADDALLVNLGDLTTRLTNEQWLSTLHRVKPPILIDSTGVATIARRRSAALFHDGDADAVIGPLPGFVTSNAPAIYAPVTVDQHVRAKLGGSRAGVLNTAAEREASRLGAHAESAGAR